MNTQNPLENEILTKLLDGKAEWLAVLRQQARVMNVQSRELTGAGFVTRFSVPGDAPKLPRDVSLQFGDVTAEINDLKYGAGFLLWIDHGNIAALEGYSFEEPWPKNIQTFCACYTHNPRDEEALTRRLQAAVRRSLISSIDSRK